MRWALAAIGLLLVGTTGCSSSSRSNRAVELVAGAAHACARMEDGVVRCWGAWKSGQRGQGVLPQAGPWKLVGSAELVPHSLAEHDDRAAQVVNLDGVEQLAAGSSHTCARRKSGTVWCWGDNASAQLGAPPDKRGLVPYPVRVAALPAAVQLAAGTRHSCMRSSDSSVWCWGADESGQLGHEGRSPAAVPGISDAVELHAGGETTCAVAVSGIVRCWGDNKFGQLGDGATGEPKRTPVQVQGIRDAVQVAVASTHACALTRSGEVLCWGANHNGQLGESAASSTQGLAVLQPRLAHASRLLIAAGATCARLPDARTWCVGAGQRTAWELPAVASAKSVALVSAATPTKTSGGAVMDNGALMGWGELGPRHASEPPSDNPIQVRW